MARVAVKVGPAVSSPWRGFTLVEMMVVMACLCCLALLVLGAYSTAVDRVNQTLCAAQLKKLWMVLHTYAESNQGYLPDTGAVSPIVGPLTPAGGGFFLDTWDSRGTPFWPAERHTGNAGNLFLLLRLQLAGPENFICPGSGDRPAFGPFSNERFSFLAFSPGSLSLTAQEQEFLRLNATRHCSYSYQNVLGWRGGDPSISPSEAEAVHLDYSPQDLAILADHNPYTQLQGECRQCLDPLEEPLANSLNHRGQGQNVLYLDGRVFWQTTPECGALLPDGTCDNIYRPAVGAVTDPTNIPRHTKDSYLVP
jgi:prepilin-type N-terminal cleavage/methylation domain-containing protein